MKPNKEEEREEREDRSQNEVEREALKCVYQDAGGEHGHGHEHRDHEHRDHEPRDHEHRSHDAVAESQSSVSEALRTMGAFDLGEISNAAKAAMDAVTAASKGLGDGGDDERSSGDAVQEAERNMCDAVEMTSRAVADAAKMMRADVGRAHEKA